MAHHVAELIQEAEGASPEARAAKASVCREAILELWAHRHSLPSGRRPFERLEPIWKVLECLNPDDDAPRCFSSPRVASKEAEEESETNSWLGLARGVDYSAKVLIRFCLSQAARPALDKSLEWITLAEAAGADEGFEGPAIRLLAWENDLLQGSTASDRARQTVEDRIERLETFARTVTELASDLRRLIQSE